jgi:UPF0271 protein
MKLNADLGEGQHWKEKNIAHTLAPHIQLANISCNLHAGDENHIQETIEICLQHEVSLGAHPSYDDRDNFGRLTHQLSKEELRELILRQWEWLEKRVSSFGGKLTHLKTHGALYNDISSDLDLFKTVHSTVQEISSELIHICSPQASSTGENLLHEGFIDRLYQPNGLLVPRTEENAVHSSLATVLEQIKDLKKGKVKTKEEKYIDLKVETLCLHGDNPLLVKNITSIVEALNES